MNHGVWIFSYNRASDVATFREIHTYTEEELKFKVDDIMSEILEDCISIARAYKMGEFTFLSAAEDFYKRIKK